MNVTDIVLSGLAATVVLTIALSAGHHLRRTRLSVAFLVGTMFTPARDRALVIGYAAHLVVGVLFAFLYAALFESLGTATWWIGAGAGLVHALFVLVVVLPVLPGLHPHMVGESAGPTPNRLLQPPGFMGLNYGRGTPYVALVAHVLFGAILGAMYGLGG